MASGSADGSDVANDLSVVNTIAPAAVGDQTIGTKTFTQTVKETDLENGLKCLFPFYGGAQDLSGNSNDGQVNGASLAENRNHAVDQAYAFEAGTTVSIPGCAGSKTVAARSA